MSVLTILDLQRQPPEVFRKISLENTCVEFSCKISKFFKSIYFEELLRTAASGFI